MEKPGHFSAAINTRGERLDARINQARYGETLSDKIEFVRISSETELKQLTTVVDDFATSKTSAQVRSDLGYDVATRYEFDDGMVQSEFIFDEFTRAIMAKIVEKCGTREYWDTWAKDIAKIAQTHITRISTIIAKDGPEKQAFSAFLEELRDDLNPQVSEQEAIEMLAQHLITKPVFDALFKDSQFTTQNPVSRAMETILAQLHEHHLEKEAESLQRFYASVERRATDIKTAQARQSLVTELYDKFFRSAFPKLTAKLGIVYTPVEVVDFIIHSVNDVLKEQFGQTLGSKGVHILDPFTGTGTFITRLLQSGLIAPEELEHKYRHEIHANEIVLLAYYIAAVNIETVYHELMHGSLLSQGDYQPYEGILLTDTFQMYKQSQDSFAALMPENSERRTKQMALDLQVIIGNPPYSAGQNSANDNAANIDYPLLDAEIAATYAAHSTATNKNALYDSYIRAIRWASDRIGKAGVMAFVTNAGWIDGNATDGMRKCLAEEFSAIYIFHLRGNARTSGEQRRKEKGNVFGEGSRAPIAIAVLVKNPNSERAGQIYFHDIGDYLDQKQKLKIISDYGSIAGIAGKSGWSVITPDAKFDWLNQTDESLDGYPIMGAKKGGETGIFENYSSGLQPRGDVWYYNSSQYSLCKNIKTSITFFNSEVARFEKEYDGKASLKDFVRVDETKFSWYGDNHKEIAKGRTFDLNRNFVRKSFYRPYTATYVYFDPDLMHRSGKMPEIFPDPEVHNFVIQVSGVGARGFSALLMKAIPCLDTIEKGQCFPLYLYENDEERENDLFSGQSEGHYKRRDAITDEGLKHFTAAFPGEEISKEDLFYYIYGLLHSPDYRSRFANNLAKQLPRIPPVKTFKDFAAFRDAGRALGHLHVNFETVEPYMVTFKEGDHRLIGEAQSDPKKFYRVTKMKFGGKGKDKDRSTVIYNDNISMQNIPLEAYDYVVNGKPALEWVMERQTVKTDKDSGIVNDANDYANETMGDPKYPLELFQRVITVRLRTR